jgi:hypothetical protein
MKRPDHTPVYVLNGQALARAGIPWIPTGGLLLGRVAIPSQLRPPAANDNTKP